MNKTTEYIILNVKGDGSCFYRSLYICLKEYNILDRIIKHLETLNTEYNNQNIEINEEEFVRLARYTLSYLIRSGKDYQIVKRVYKNFETYDNETFKEVLKSFPQWFNFKFYYIKDYNEKIMTTRIFSNTFSESIKENINWVTEIEIEILKNIFSELGINIVIINNKVKENFLFNDKTIYVMNIRECHYVSILPKFNNDIIQYKELIEKEKDVEKEKYVEKDVELVKEDIIPRLKILNPKTGRYVLANGKIGKKIQGLIK